MHLFHHKNRNKNKLIIKNKIDFHRHITLVYNPGGAKNLKKKKKNKNTKTHTYLKSERERQKKKNSYVYKLAAKQARKKGKKIAINRVNFNHS